MKGELRVLPQRGDGPDLQTEVDTLALQLASATQQLQIMAQERFNLVRALNVIIMAAGNSIAIPLAATQQLDDEDQIQLGQNETHFLARRVPKAPPASKLIIAKTVPMMRGLN